MGTRVPTKQGAPLTRSGSIDIIPDRGSDGGTSSVSSSLAKGSGLCEGTVWDILFFLLLLGHYVSDERRCWYRAGLASLQPLRQIVQCRLDLFIGLVARPLSGHDIRQGFAGWNGT